MGEILFLSLFLIGSIYLFLLTGDFRLSKMDTSGGAALFPRIVIIFLCLFLVIRIIQALCEKEKKPFAIRELWEGSRRFFILSLVGYVLLLKGLGYIISTILFLIITCNGFRFYETNSWEFKKSLVVSNLLLVVFVLALNFFFKNLLSVYLPAGILSL